MKKLLRNKDFIWGLVTCIIILPLLGVLVYALAKMPTTPPPTTTNEVEHKGRCLEYKTEYKLDCGLFVSKDSFCVERKYDVCVRWEENE